MLPGGVESAIEEALEDAYDDGYAKGQDDAQKYVNEKTGSLDKLDRLVEDEHRDWHAEAAIYPVRQCPYPLCYGYTRLKEEMNAER